MYKILTLITIFSFTLFGQTYKQVKIYLNEKEDIRTLAAFNLNLDHFQRTKDNTIVTFLNDAEFNRLTMLNFRYEVLIDDWQVHYNKRVKMTSLEKGRRSRRAHGNLALQILATVQWAGITLLMK